MFDSQVRALIDPPLNAIAHRLAAAGVSADQLTITGALLGLASAIAIATDHMIAALVLFVAGRGLDGLDGAVARQTQPTNRGGFLDIVLDFVVYAAIPLAFAVRDPVANALPAATLIASFLVNGAAFLAFALMAERLKLETRAQGLKSMFYLAGLAEGTETIVVFIAFCLFPGWFAALAYAFAALCFVSGAARIAIAWQRL